MLVASGFFSVSAQEPVPGKGETIFDKLEKPESGKGTVSVKQSEKLKMLVGSRKTGANVEIEDEKAFLRAQGYRTQVFSGNNKEKEIKELFPEVPTYVTYNAPFWKLRVGDFLSHEEAYHMMRQLMDAFPAYAKEMYIVKEEIKIPLDE